MKKIFKRFEKTLSLYRYAFKYRNQHLTSYDDKTENDLIFLISDLKKPSIPKKIWMYWGGNTLSDYVQKMIARIREQNPDHQLVVLNDSTLDNYISPVVFLAEDIPIANKSDIIRLEILKKYGGIWIDASTLFFQNLSWVHELNQQNNYDLIGFYNETATTDLDYPIIENWFICAPPENPFIIRWLEILSPLKELGAAAYYEMISTRSDYVEIRQKISDPKYLLAHLAHQIAMRQLSAINIYTKRCEASAFLYQESVLWNADKLARLLCFKQAPEQLPPLIKLTNDNRRAIEQVIKFNLVNKNSIIGLLYNNK